jgi:hypothetical protein
MNGAKKLNVIIRKAEYPPTFSSIFTLVYFTKDIVFAWSTECLADLQH